MQDLKTQLTWLKALLEQRARQRNDDGYTSVEWLMIALGVITIAGVAVAAVQAYVTGQTHKLGNP